MALVTLQRSPTPSVASSASTATTNAGEDFGSDDDRKANQSLSESFFMVKGAALFLQQGNSNQEAKTPTHHKHAGDLPQHLQVMINTLRSEDRIKLAVRLESGWSERLRYMVVVYTSGRQDTEENVLLGMDFTDKDSKSCSIGLVLPLWSDTNIHLDGDGGFSVTTAGRSHVFKPVSVQAMWSALQVLHKACEVSRRLNYFPGGMALTWTGFYQSCIASEQSCVNEWNAMSGLESARPGSPSMPVDRPTERERTEVQIRAKLRSIMMFQDLENITSKEIRTELELHMGQDLNEYKEFMDNEMLLILGQMDKATPIFDHLYLGSEWNASNFEELQDCGVGYILNVTREIDNFFPGTFSYHNVRVYDEDTTDLMAHWNDTYNFIIRAKRNRSKCLVHCKMGVSRSASTVIAYAMKEYGWSLEKAFSFVQQRRGVARPNAGFMRQLAEYEGILDASKQRHNRLWRREASQEASEEPQNADAPGEETPVLPGSEQEEEEGEAWGGLEPLDPLNYNYYFRRLSDTALDGEPCASAPRGPPLRGMEGVFIQIEDVERDALLDDQGFLALPATHSPLEETRLRLEFSTVEEEDEEEAQKEEAEMAALARPAGEEEEEGEAVEGGSRLGLANLNTNNSNRLAAKRSCPAAFDDSASTGNPFKVKPSYLSCEGCLRLPRPPGGHVQRLNPARHCSVPLISVDPPAPPPAPPLAPARLEAYRQRLASPMSCEDLPRPRHCCLETQDMEEEEEEGEEEGEEEEGGRAGRGRREARGTGAVTELTLLRLSLEGGRPAAGAGGPGVQPPAGEGAQQQQLQRGGPAQLGAGLVRQRAEQLERLYGPEQMDLSPGEGLGPGEGEGEGLGGHGGGGRFRTALRFARAVRRPRRLGAPGDAPPTLGPAPPGLGPAPTAALHRHPQRQPPRPTRPAQPARPGEAGRPHPALRLPGRAGRPHPLLLGGRLHGDRLALGPEGRSAALRLLPPAPPPPRPLTPPPPPPPLLGAVCTPRHPAWHAN